jgi:O-antigen/teichoic acid export membrane protein
MPSVKVTNIAKNTSYFTFALILQKILSFTYFTIIARALGPEDLGKYYLAISLTTMFAIFIDIGLANVLTREVAKSKEKAQDLLGSVLAIKLPLAGVSILLLVIIVNLLGYPELTRTLVYLSVISMVLDSFTLSFFSCMRGFHNLFFESIASVVFQLIVLSFGFIALHLGLSLRWLIGALISASIFHFAYSSLLIRFKWKIKLKPIINRKLISLLIKITIPFALFGILQRVYMYLDTVLLSILAGDKYVGLYQIAFKIVFALQFLPMAFIASLYPAFASYWKNNREQLTVTFERAMKYLIIISLPISTGIIVLADKIILLFKEGYDEAILPLRLIMVSLIFIFLIFPVGSLLNACDRQKVNTAIMGVGLTISVIMNLILIPMYKTVGASITVVVSNFTMFVLMMSWVPKIISYRPKKIIFTFLKALAAVIIMAISAIYLKHTLNIFIVVVISGIIYFTFLLLFGGFKKEDIISIWNSFIKKGA